MSTYEIPYGKPQILLLRNTEAELTDLLPPT